MPPVHHHLRAGRSEASACVHLGRDQFRRQRPGWIEEEQIKAQIKGLGGAGEKVFDRPGSDRGLATETNRIEVTAKRLERLATTFDKGGMGSATRKRLDPDAP